MSVSAMGIFRFFVCLFLLHLSSASFASEIDLETGLVAHYKFDGDFTDSSGTGNHGAQQGGVTFVEGVDGQAAYFDGNDDFVSVPHTDSLALDQNLSISLWLKPEYRDPVNGVGNSTIILVKNHHTGNNYSLWTGLDVGHFSYQQYPASSAPRYTFSVDQPILVDDFVNIIVVRGPNDLKIYLNGNEVYTENINYNAQLGSLPLYIGGGNTYNKYKGYIDDVRIYNRSLSPDEVNRLAATESQTISVTLDYPFTGSPEIFITPQTVNSVVAELYGAQGGDPDFGGLGGKVFVEIPVLNGEELMLYVGAAGYGHDETGLNGFNGGGNDGDVLSGGGASDIRKGGNSLSDRVVVAGGGGQRGLIHGEVGFISGGNGGGLVGATGPDVDSNTTGGTGGTQTDGGIGGCGNIYCRRDGVLGNGGPGDDNQGHGGGGYYGGGGGGSSVGIRRGAGGGGSSYISPDLVEIENLQGVRAGDGFISITFELVDSDADGFPNDCTGSCIDAGLITDNCPLINNPNQLDTDGDSIGDVCEIEDQAISHSFESKQFSLQELYSTFLPESRSLTLDQDFLGIGPSQSGPHNEVLWRIPVLEEGTLNSEDNFIVQIEIGENRNFGSVDKDLLVGISDGNNFIQFTNNDYTNGGSGAWMIQDGGEFIVETSPHAGNVVGFDRKNYRLNFSFIDNDIDLKIIDLDDVYDDVELSYSHGQEMFDRSKGFDLLIVANETHENFSLRSLSVTYPSYTSQDNTVIDSDSDGIDDGSDSDADNDGLPNDYETANGLNPVDASDAQSDSDMDGLTVLEEFTAGTDLNSKDTDRDTLPDGWEVENGKDPLVADYQIALAKGTPIHACALDDSGVKCWGNNSVGQIEVPELSDPSKIFTGFGLSCALDENVLKCWGQNGAGEFYSSIPQLVNPNDLSIGLYHSCAIDDTGVVCWGYNNYGQTNVPELINPQKITSGYYHSCAIDDSGVVCWGNDQHGQGLQDQPLDNVPTLVNPKKISAGFYNTCAIDDSGVVCWGNNLYYQNNVPNLSNPTDISVGKYHVCALDDSGVVCWGYNQYSQAHVPSLNYPYKVSAGGNYSCALDDTGIVCWGEIDFDEAIPEFIKDPDNDGFLSHNNGDAFPLDPNEWHDTDLDGVGNNADLDDDNDGFADTYEIANNLDPLVANLDIDNDGIANDIDADIDGDGMLNDMDALPLDANEQIDSDSDGVGNNSDADNDNDGVINTLDLFPLNAFESADSDGDGVGDNADFFPNSAEYSLDSDLDQMPDAWERKYGLNPTDASDALLDQDNDGLTALEEYEAGTIPLKILDIDANGSFDALTDGLIILRYAFGLRGENLVKSATAGDAMRTDAADVEAYLNSLVPGL
jgi:alpha-tubulin suppressor-like RCC1 family protein